MITCKLQAVKADSIDFINTLENGTKINLGHNYTYNVQYAKEGPVCRGQFEIDVHDRDNEGGFHVKVKLTGIFQFDPDERREAIHAESFKIIFPYAKALITTITANAGIPPIIIPDIDIDSQEIYRFDGSAQ